MQSQILSWDKDQRRLLPQGALPDADLVLYFGPNPEICDPHFQMAIRGDFPGARTLGCTTGTAISGADLADESVVAVAVKFDGTRCRTTSAPVSIEGSREAGATIGAALAAPDLSGVFVLSDSLNVDGAELLGGMRDALGPSVPISGGLASDGADFQRTMVGLDAGPTEKLVAAVGFYGDGFCLGQGCAHGWDHFGPPRVITHAEGNILYELDGKPALDLYMQYLGEDAADLPGSALRFPLLVSDPNDPAREVIRTVLNIDRDARTLTFASSIPSGWRARLMRAALDHLTDGATNAALEARNAAVQGAGGVAILVSCVGRRIVFGQGAADETEAVHAVLSPQMNQVGFYSHGEISSAHGGAIGLHNQTMTILTLQERA